MLRNIKRIGGICLTTTALIHLPLWAAGGHGEEATPPSMSPAATQVDHEAELFGPDPSYEDKPYNTDAQLNIYGGKREVENPRPLLELGRPIYEAGPLSPPGHGLGRKNPTDHAFSLYGDWRTAIAYNDKGLVETGELATRLNLEADWKFTGTERLHAAFRPLDQDGDFTRCEFSGDTPADCKDNTDLTPDSFFFEGDLGAISAGISDRYSSFDLPIALGKMPLILQNGIWLDDFATGAAVTLPALNSPSLDISNMDITFMALVDDVSSGGMVEANGNIAEHNANIYAITSFIEANEGYWELGWGYTDGEGVLDDQSYHNASVAFTKRYGGWLSNSVRLIHNWGQDRLNGARQTADGTLLLIENSLITSKPLTLIPYLNLFAGFDRPQSLARDPGAGGVLKNTGINFETDGLTGFPTLDASANNTYGAALGVEYLFGLDRQIVVELATVQTREDAASRAIPGEQYALGLRYQQNIDRAWLFRIDAMAGSRKGLEDIGGIRFEIRRKF
ncbi:MAG: hypothetical protein ACPG4N_09155 [Gammaproteobacteria bacterium]